MSKDLDLKGLAVIIILTLVYMVAMLYWVTEGFSHFYYTLDDPYIHLKLARNIADGHYGFNPQEFSAPSSSILWPFLLAPFAKMSGFVYVPLILNFLVATTSTACLFCFFRKKNFSRLLSIGLSLFGFLLINGFGLVMTGLEHMLQVLVVILLVNKLSIEQERPHDKTSWSIVALLTLGLMVRYEMLIFWAGFVGFYFWQRDFKKAIAVLIIPLVPVLLFSAFLLSLKLGPLPNSVMAKTSSDGTFIVNLWSNFANNLVLGQGFALFALTALLLVMMAFKRVKISILWLVVIPTFLHLLVGKFGWFFRYEIYIFTYVGLLYFLKPVQVKPYFFILFLIAFWPYAANVKRQHQAVRNIRFQHGVTTEFLQKYLNEPVGLNDIGMPGFYHEHYVLDLWGLASREALQNRIHSADFNWIDQLAKQKGVEVLIIYDSWIALSKNWALVAKFELSEQNVVLGSKTISVYTNFNRKSELRAALSSFEMSNIPIQGIVRILIEKENQKSF